MLHLGNKLVALDQSTRVGEENWLSEKTRNMKPAERERTLSECAYFLKNVARYSQNIPKKTTTVEFNGLFYYY
jgi:hypothetical protein